MNRLLIMNKNGHKGSTTLLLITILVSSVSLIVASFQWYDSQKTLRKPKFLMPEFGDNNFYRRRRTTSSSSSSSSSSLSLSITNCNYRSQQRWPSRTSSFTRTKITQRINVKNINTIQSVAGTHLASSNTNELVGKKLKTLLKCLSHNQVVNNTHINIAFLYQCKKI
jgi:PDZ domain-containing secreted protein